MKLSPFLADFEHVYALDFEFKAPEGDPPEPICMVVKELHSGKEVRYWIDELQDMKCFPLEHSEKSVFVAYYASAEMNCFLALNWALPANILDLYAEFRNQTNGKHVAGGWGLVGALTYYGVDSIGSSEKNEMRQLALRGGPWSDLEKQHLLDYCATDVYALEKLLLKMGDQIDFERALIRGNFVKAVASIERAGIPIDVDTLSDLRSSWAQIQDRLIEQIAAAYGVYDGRSFRRDKFADWLAKNQISWPTTIGGALKLDADTFREMAKSNQLVAPLHELRATLSQLRLNELPVGKDGRNRTMLSYLRSKTGRNQPSNSRFIFGPATWIRSLIKPQPGFALAYIDWSQQEFGIAAALSGDEKMKGAYRSGDPYLAFAIQAGAAPQCATKNSHADVRNLFKQCVLAVQYGMAGDSLAQRINKSVAEANGLLRLHRETYSTFWSWSDAVSHFAMAFGYLTTVFGWHLSVGEEPNDRSIRNFPMQANGAEMLRLACVEAIERGIKVCAPVHDAILIEAPADKINERVTQMQEVMAWASEVVLDGFTLSTDVHLVCSGERYFDKRGESLWHRINSIVEGLKAEQECARGGYQ
jgi:DNA polymerase-1